MPEPSHDNTGSDMGLKRQLGLWSMTFAVVTGTIGSGWLFAPFLCAKLAGPASLLAWLFGGLMSFGIGIVFAELGALVTSSGALAEIPLLTHGRTSGFIGGWSVWISYVSIPAIEVLAMMQYLASKFPWLTITVGNEQILSTAGIGCAAVMLCLFAWINLSGIGILAKWVDGLTFWKLTIPLLVSVTLMVRQSHWGNLVEKIPWDGTIRDEILTAVSTGGVLFSLFGFQTAMNLAGESKRPQRDVPLSMGMGLAISLAIYMVLQLAFLVSVDPSQLTHGWSQLVLSAHGGPLVAIALGAGLIWVANLLLVDAVLSPGATAMAYMGVSARVSWMMGKCELLPKCFQRLNDQSVPWVGLISSLVIGIIMLFGGPSWQRIVGFLTATIVIALAVGPVSLMALRKQLPGVKRPFRLIAAGLWCRLAFVMATWSILWSGKTSVLWATGAILLPTILLLVPQWLRGRQLEMRNGLWWIAYLGGLIALLCITAPDGWHPLALRPQMVLAALFALAIFPIAVSSRLERISPDSQLKFTDKITDKHPGD
jgi:amino acid transporter